jgi:predicted nucleic-acid-binding protein
MLLKKLLKNQKLFINLEVEVLYSILPKVLNIPEQIDIKAVYVLSSNKKTRKKDILKLLSESEIINLEDRLVENEER